MELQAALKILRLTRSKYAFVPKMHRRKMYNRVRDAVRRCTDPRNKDYMRYGGRGITVYPAWQEDRRLFARYLMTLDGWDNPDLTIDRIDNDGNYEPGNLRFVTQTENRRNRKTKG